MISMTRASLKLCVAAAALAAALPIAPSHAENFAVVSINGSGTACTVAQPCADVPTALPITQPHTRVVCVNGAVPSGAVAAFGNADTWIDIDCPLGSIASLQFLGGNNTVRVRHLAFRNAGGVQNDHELVFKGSGTLILEDCVFGDSPSAAIDIEPTGPVNLVIKNSTISSNGSGILLKPASGGSIKATLDHVTITDNNGGGIKTDSTDGVVNLDVSNSEISNNAGNGINALAGNNQNIVGIKSSVFARNGAAGVQVNGANAGVLAATTLFDQNVAGATSVVSGGNMFSYGNNDVVGGLGSGFPSTAPLY
jgi:hypothetical protein